ncbi:MAG: DUF4886 domain-containing protein [Bacteroidota bacterium]
MSTDVFSQAQGGKNISVLFIGNSYTYVNNLPGIVQQIGYSMGDSIFVDQSTVGGYSLEEHSTYPPTLSKINQQPWDYVVLQDQSQKPSLEPGYVDTAVIPYALFLDSLIHVNNVCTKTVFYMTWGRKYGDASNCAFYPPVCTYEGMQQRLKESYLLMGDTCHGIVAPVGEAFHLSIQTDSAFNLYQTDFSHPSLEGSFLAASTIYSTITHKQIINQNYTAGLPVDTAAYLQYTAWATVKDSSLLWNLGVNEPFALFDYQMTGNLLAQFICPGNQNYQHTWYFGDTTTSTIAEPLHQYGYSFYFTVSHVVYDSCSYDSTVAVINITGTNGIQKFENHDYELFFDNQLQSLIFNSAVEPGEVFQIVLYNSAGKECLKKELVADGNKKLISLKNFSEGIYISKLLNEKRKSFFTQKISILH